MSTLNYLCEHDISDDDCYKCSKHGIVFRCPKDCADFKDVRKRMTPEEREDRQRLMEIYGIEDDPEWDEKG